VYKLWTVKVLTQEMVFDKEYPSMVEKKIKVVYTLLMSVTYQPKKRKRAKTHGFLVRAKTAGGKKVVQRRRAKGRARLAV